MNPRIVLSLSLIATGLLVAALFWIQDGGRHGLDPRATTSPAAAHASIVVYCAASFRRPLEAAATQYERETGIRIGLQYGGSQTLLANIKLANSGDLYVPADASYLDLARSDGLVAESVAVATMRPVLAVRRGNPGGIRSLRDLLRPDVRLGLADPGAAAIGKVVKERLDAGGHWQAIERAAVVTKPTVSDIAMDVQLNAIDAAFVWDVTVRQLSADLEAVHLPELDGAASTIGVAVLTTSRAPAAARRFLRYLASSDKGSPHLVREGFVALPHGVWDASQD